MGRPILSKSVAQPDGYHLNALRAAIKPFRLVWAATLRSTSDHAAALRRRGVLFAPAIVLTGRQTAGRGRGGNSWWSGKGCITATFVLPADEQVEPTHLPFVAGLAVRNAAAELCGRDDIQLKWPNDVLFENRKLAGLLCERIDGVDLIGLGLNVNPSPTFAPAALRDRVTSLSEIAGRPLDLTGALIALSSHLQRAIVRRPEQSFAAVLREYDAHHCLIGRTVTVAGAGDVAPVTGLCVGLDETGRLLVKVRSKVYPIVSGTVVAR